MPREDSNITTNTETSPNSVTIQAHNLIPVGTNTLEYSYDLKSWYPHTNVTGKTNLTVNIDSTNMLQFFRIKYTK